MLNFRVVDKTIMSEPLVYRLRFQMRSGYMYAGIQAERITRRTALDYFAEIAFKCAAVHCKRLLLDRDIPAILPNGDFHKTLKDYVEMSRGMKIAFVNRHITTDAAWKTAIGDINGEGAGFGYFQDSDAAEKWLLANP